MSSLRQPSVQFLRRLKAYSEPATKPASRIRRYKASDAWLWTEVAAVVVGLAFVIPTSIALWIDLEDRQTQRIVQAWQLVTQVAPGNSGKGPALEYLNSQGIPLVGINLSEKNNRGRSYLVGVDLSGVNLVRANLSGANLVKADLSGADLSWINLSEALLERADLSGTDLRMANLSGAHFEDANLSEAYLWNANLSGAYLLNADLSGTRLLDANLSGANLRFGDLSEANLVRANLSGANLYYANLSGAYLLSANLSGANLESANLLGAKLVSANLSGANLWRGRQIDQSQLDAACGDEKTQLPKGFTIKHCDEK